MIDNVKKMKIWLSITLVLFTIVFFVFVLALVVYIPSYVNGSIGAPGEFVSLPRSIILSAKIFPGINTFNENLTLNHKVKNFIVEPGKTASEIASGLEKAGIIDESANILLYWEYKGLDRFIRDGVYLIDPRIPVREVGDQLATGITGYTTFAFLAGMRKEEVDTLLVQSGLLSSLPDINLSYCQPEQINLVNGVEGFLFPDTYQIPEGLNGEDIYCLFTDHFFGSLSENYTEEITLQGLNLYEAVILASIIEKEMVDESEAARIAGVFLNRLAIDMPLQSDPTVQYAVASIQGGNDWWKVDISREDLLVDSPYNTYQVNGLPPTPICNPGLAALDAVANPEVHNYLYFRATCDDSRQHIFSETYEEHLSADCK